MDKQQATTLLEKWREAMQECDRQTEALAQLTDARPESPLLDAIGRLQGAYTELIADTLQADFIMLEDWWLSHNFGKKPMLAGINNQPMRRIENSEQLADFITTLNESEG